jgi:hypothetical protein
VRLMSSNVVHHHSLFALRKNYKKIRELCKHIEHAKVNDN